MAEKKPFLPWTLPWNDSTGNLLKPAQIILTRKFTYSYIVIIWFIWLTSGQGPENDCRMTNGGLFCIGGLWPADIIDSPLRFLLSIPIAPIFHNSQEHINFVTVGFLVFVQSFEIKEGTIRTVFLFILFTAVAALIMSTGMNLAELFWPNSDLLAEGFSRNWMGGSGGFYGIIGASAHQSNKIWLIPTLAIIFEYWNHFFHGISLFTSSAHMTSLICGFLIWGYWTSTQRQSTGSN